MPCLADIDVASSTLPFFVELRDTYAALRAQCESLHAFYAQLEAPEHDYYEYDGQRVLKYKPQNLIPLARLPESIGAFFATSSSLKPPAQRNLCSIVHHGNWRSLHLDLRASDRLSTSAFKARESTRLTACCTEYSGIHLFISPKSVKQPSALYLTTLQQRFGLYLSIGVPLWNALEAINEPVTEDDRLGITLAHAANHQQPHKWLCTAWRKASGNATTGTVFLGDKGKGPSTYKEYNEYHVPDVITLRSGCVAGAESVGGDGALGGADDGDGSRPALDEVKNYSPFTTKNTSTKGTLNIGASYLFGNQREKLKKSVLGGRERGLRCDPPFDHKTGKGHVPASPLPGERGAADYADAIINKKADVRLLIHGRPRGLRGSPPALPRAPGGGRRQRQHRLLAVAHGEQLRAVLRAAPHQRQLHERRQGHPQAGLLAPQPAPAQAGCGAREHGARVPELLGAVDPHGPTPRHQPPHTLPRRARRVRRRMTLPHRGPRSPAL